MDVRLGYTEASENIESEAKLEQIVVIATMRNVSCFFWFLCVHLFVFQFRLKTDKTQISRVPFIMECCYVKQLIIKI